MPSITTRRAAGPDWPDGSMIREEKRRLLGYLVEKVVPGDGGVTLYLRSETLEAANVNHPEGKYPPGGKWLRLLDDYRTFWVGEGHDIRVALNKVVLVMAT